MSHPQYPTNSTAITNWASEPQGRGTIGLIWSCFATIFLCTWNAIHPNLPTAYDSERRIYWRRICYVVFALIIPEWYCYIALDSLARARQVREKQPTWSLTQCFFCCMGGFAVEHDSRSIRMPASQLLEFFDNGLISWPEPLDSQINDRTKADWIMKMLALLQVLWFVVQLVGRAAQHLPITTLELFTAGIIVCGIVMYAAWWQKPFDVRQPIVLRPKAPLPVAIEAAERINLSEADSGSHWPMRVGGTILGLGFGAMHLFGWNFYFPSEAEKLLWRVSSAGCAALPLMVLLGDCCNLQLPEPWDAAKDIGITCMYALFRIYMLIEMVVGLRAVPVDAYKTPQWSQYFPAFN